jgi:hypothetical protein
MHEPVTHVRFGADNTANPGAIDNVVIKVRAVNTGSTNLISRHRLF